MLDDSGRERYARHLLLPEVGEAGQLKLKGAKVALLGAGGLGSPGRLGKGGEELPDTTREVCFSSNTPLGQRPGEF